MADHDELCPATIADGRWRARCECALIARVRADENMKVCRCGCMERDAHAEAVAARLVEVIVRQEYGLQQWHRATADVTYSLAQERDAARARTVEAEQKVIDAHREVALARAEVAALAEKLAKCTDDKVAERVAFGKERNALKAEVAALRQALAVEQSRTTFARIAVREVLADLRDKVSSGWIPELDHEARIAVLALIEEADRG